MVTEVNLSTLNNWINNIIVDIPKIEKYLITYEPDEINIDEMILKKFKEFLKEFKNKEFTIKYDVLKNLEIIEKDIINKKLTKNDIQEFQKIIDLYKINLNKDIDKIIPDIQKSINLIPKKWSENINKFSFSLKKSFEEHRINSIGPTSEKVLDIIIDLNETKNITELVKEINKKLDRKIDFSHVWQIIEYLERRELIETIGGYKRGGYKRYCFPNFFKRDRNLHDGKEIIFRGYPSVDLTNILDFSKAKKYISLFEFNSTISPSIYVITNYSNFKQEEMIKTIGIFNKGNLNEHLHNLYNIKISGKNNNHLDGDSVFAYLHIGANNDIVYWDKERKRAEELKNNISLEIPNK